MVTRVGRGAAGIETSEVAKVAKVAKTALVMSSEEVTTAVWRWSRLVAAVAAESVKVAVAL